MKLWRIYGYRSPENKWYIGQTIQNVNRRAKSGAGYLVYLNPFAEAIMKYGWDNMEQNILRLCTSQEEANYWEKFYIDQYNSVYPNGYNIQEGGKGYQRRSNYHFNDELYDNWLNFKHTNQYIRGPKGKVCYNNGTINIYININTDTIPEGFVKGHLK